MPIPPPPLTLPDLPSGWQRARRGVTPAVVAVAREVLHTPGIKYGGGHVREVEGKVWAFRREPHYDDHVDGVLRWHPGISVWVRESDDAVIPEELRSFLQAVEKVGTSPVLLIGVFLAASAVGFLAAGRI